MCLLIAKKEGVQYGRISQAIRNGASGNPDGWGYAIKRKGTHIIHLKKDFDSAEDMITALEDEKVSLYDELIVHLRFGTAGKKNHENAHPYVISRGANYFKKTDVYSAMPVMAHNGCLSGYGDNDISDTYEFVLKVMAHPHCLSVLLTNPKEFFEDKAVIKTLSWSRIAIMFPHRPMHWYGPKEEFEGVMYSNGGYKGKGFENPAPATNQLSIIPGGNTSATPPPVSTKFNRDNERTVTTMEAQINITTPHHTPLKTVKKLTGENRESILHIPYKEIPDGTVITEDVLSMYLSDKLMMNNTTFARFSYSSLQIMYQRLFVLKETLGIDYAVSDYFLPSVFKIADAFELLKNTVKDNYPTLLYEAFLRYIPGNGRTENTMIQDVVRIDDSVLKDILSYPEEYVLIGKTSCPIASQGTKFLVITSKDALTSDAIEIVVENTFDSQRKIITDTTLKDGFLAVKNPAERSALHDKSTFVVNIQKDVTSKLTNLANIADNIE